MRYFRFCTLSLGGGDARTGFKKSTMMWKVDTLVMPAGWALVNAMGLDKSLQNHCGKVCLVIFCLRGIGGSSVVSLSSGWVRNNLRKWEKNDIGWSIVRNMDVSPESAGSTDVFVGRNLSQKTVEITQNNYRLKKNGKFLYWLPCKSMVS